MKSSTQTTKTWSILNGLLALPRNKLPPNDKSRKLEGQVARSSPVQREVTVYFSRQRLIFFQAKPPRNKFKWTSTNYSLEEKVKYMGRCFIARHVRIEDIFGARRKITKIKYRLFSRAHFGRGTRLKFPPLFWREPRTFSNRPLSTLAKKKKKGKIISTIVDNVYKCHHRIINQSCIYKFIIGLSL